MSFGSVVSVFLRAILVLVLIFVFNRVASVIVFFEKSKVRKSLIAGKYKMSQTEVFYTFDNGENLAPQAIYISVSSKSFKFCRIGK